MNVPDYVVVIVALALYQTSVTVMVVRSPHFAQREKFSQILVIWLLPFIGAVIVRIAHNGARNKAAAAAAPSAPAASSPVEPPH
ncbi:MAG: hypothetical protein ABI831_22740 [Betaproteobacteria bacterium]